MAKSKSQATQESVPATPKGVTIKPGHWKVSKPITLGDTVWFPFPRVHTVTLERGISEPRQIKVSEQSVGSFIHACFYKFGGATGDCVGSATVELRGPGGKKTGATRKATRKEITKRMDDRLQSIVDGTYVGVAKGPRGIPIPEELVEGIVIVALHTNKGKDWCDALSRQYQSKLIARKDLESTLANTVASYGKNSEATPERVTKSYAWIMNKVASVFKIRKAEWNEEDDDLLA